MQLSSVLNDYGHFFYIIGQSTYNPCVRTQHTCRKLLCLQYFVYFGTYFTIISVLTVVGLALEIYAQKTTQSDEKSPPFLAIGIVVTACSNFAAMIQCKLYPNALETIHQLFSQVDHLCKRNLHRTIFYEPYRKVYQVKFYVLVVLFVMDFFVVMILNILNDRELPITGIALILMCISVLSHLHTLFYIGLHVFIYEKFCKIVDSVCGANRVRNGKKEDDLLVRNGRQIVTKFQIYKIVHFKLWMASQKISEYFGWEIIVFYLQNFLLMTNSAFFIYVFAQNGRVSETGIMRMY